MRLTDALRMAANTGGLHSLFVARRGFAIVDAYAYPYDKSLYHDVASVTKSILTLLVGIAAERGELDLDAPVASFFPDRTIADREDKTPITLRHLLTMTSGLDCTNVPREDELAQMQQSDDFVGFALDLTVVAEPGTRWSYCSPGMHLLSAALQQATGATTLEYAMAHLFGPLGIEDVYWPTDPQGVTHGWGDLALRPQDAAKVGHLLLHAGAWDGTQIVSRQWTSDATTAHVGTPLHEDYGYGWYVAPASEDIFYVRADGAGGQRILIVPSLDLVIVTTGSNLDAPALLEAVVGAMTEGGDPLPANATGVAALAALGDELATGPAAQPPPAPPAIAAQVSGRTYTLADNALGLQTLRLDFDESEATLTLARAGEPAMRIDRVGLDGRFRPSVAGRPIVARGAWQDADTFVMELDEGPGLHNYDVALDFGDQSVVLRALGMTVLGSAGA